VKDISRRKQDSLSYKSIKLGTRLLLLIIGFVLGWESYSYCLEFYKPEDIRFFLVIYDIIQHIGGINTIIISLTTFITTLSGLILAIKKLKK